MLGIPQVIGGPRATPGMPNSRHHVALKRKLSAQAVEEVVVAASRNSFTMRRTQHPRIGKHHLMHGRDQLAAVQLQVRLDLLSRRHNCSAQTIGSCCSRLKSIL